MKVPLLSPSALVLVMASRSWRQIDPPCDIRQFRARDHRRLWSAVDTVTGTGTHIGSYTLPTGKGALRPSRRLQTWFSGTPGINATRHAALPYQKTIFGGPRTNRTHAAGPVGTQETAYVDGDCAGQAGFHSERVEGRIEVICGV
ncbi:hypothetical protein B0H16DRAFT_1460986 [Mycena metata]|uniref:Uncharacterized protein n=1 Tax=Mycena metata TaxID=1033252 RepID=A0AAD7N8D7_9AGAR|nr:hypothetical protein B0H16DRAFT_872983 [Mycena metata]KAJ7749966.1 hypothetical protein B0H16DRAFT_1460986 [Mycena metata]